MIAEFSRNRGMISRKRERGLWYLLIPDTKGGVEALEGLLVTPPPIAYIPSTPQTDASYRSQTLAPVLKLTHRR